MKKIITLLTLFCLLISCERKEPNFSKEMIGKLIVENNGLPSYYLSFDLYVQTNNNEIYKTNNHELSAFYKQYYFRKFKTFHEFLDKVLNQTFVLDKRLFKKLTYLESFKPKSNAEKEYARLGIKRFLSKYSKITASKRIALKREIIKEGERETIAYFLFKNGYDLSSDCYLGIDYIRKREESFK
nr:hypothetical protein [uncultured Flavobacterium sp.]